MGGWGGRGGVCHCVYVCVCENEKERERMQNKEVAKEIETERGLQQVSSVKIRTQTSAKSLDKLVCPGDLIRQSNLAH